MIRYVGGAGKKLTSVLEQQVVVKRRFFRLKRWAFCAAVFIAVWFVSQFVHGYVDEVGKMREELEQAQNDLAIANEKLAQQKDANSALASVSANWPRFKTLHLNGEMLIYFVPQQVHPHE